MRPEEKAINRTPEVRTINESQKIEQKTNQFNPETSISDVEKTLNSGENSSIISENILSTILPIPVIDDSSAVTTTTVSTLNPVVAGDDDLIEKEWVDRAKKIVEETRDNPYQRDKSIGFLQIDYIKKRYGKELGSAE